MQGIYPHKRQASRDAQPFVNVKSTLPITPHLVTSNLPPTISQLPTHHNASPFSFLPPLQLNHNHSLQSVQEQQENNDLKPTQVPPQHSQSQGQFIQPPSLYSQQQQQQQQQLPQHLQQQLPQHQQLPPQISFTSPTPVTYNPPQNFPQLNNKRVWVKRPGKTATTLMVGPNDIIDDLKTLVLQKYPTSLAIQVDPSDLVVKMEVSLSLSPGAQGLTSQLIKSDSYTKMHPEPLLSSSAMNQTGSYSRTPVGGKSAAKKPRSSTVDTQLAYLKSSVSPVSPVPISTSKSSLLPQRAVPDFTLPLNGKMTRKSSTGSLVNNKLTTPSCMVLEPDVLVWKILDQYFPAGMRMQDAFVVDYHSSTFNPDPVIPLPQSSRLYAPLGRTSTAPSHYGTIVEVDGRGTPQSLPQSSAIATGPKPHTTPREMAFPNNSEYNTLLDSSFSFKTAILGDNRTLPSPREAKFSTRQGSLDQVPAASSTVILFPKTKKTGSKSPTQGQPSNTNNTTSSIPANSTHSSTTGSAPKNKETSVTPSTAKSDQIISPSPPSKKSDIKSNDKPKASSISSTLRNVKSNKNSIKQNKVKNPITISMRQKQLPNGMKKQSHAGLSKIMSHVNVLVVEDNLVNQKIMARHLKSCNVMYKIASTGQEALEMWKEGGFQLCFMDIQLPVMSGIEVAQKIRRLERLNHIGNFAQSSSYNNPLEVQNIDPSDKLKLDQFKSPIIIVALTASTSAKDKQDALAAGCNDYLTKPVQLKWLKSKLTEWGCMQALINYERFRNDN